MSEGGKRRKRAATLLRRRDNENIIKHTGSRPRLRVGTFPCLRIAQSEDKHTFKVFFFIIIPLLLSEETISVLIVQKSGVFDLVVACT